MPSLRIGECHLSGEEPAIVANIAIGKENIHGAVVGLRRQIAGGEERILGVIVRICVNFSGTGNCNRRIKYIARGN